MHIWLLWVCLICASRQLCNGGETTALTMWRGVLLSEKWLLLLSSAGQHHSTNMCIHVLLIDKTEITETVPIISHVVIQLSDSPKSIYISHRFITAIKTEIHLAQQHGGCPHQQRQVWGYPAIRTLSNHQYAIQPSSSHQEVVLQISRNMQILSLQIKISQCFRLKKHDNIKKCLSKCEKLILTASSKHLFRCTS